MQESWARLHGWRRRGRVVGGGGGGGGAGDFRSGRGDLMRNSCPRMEGSGWGFWVRELGGGCTTLALLRSRPGLCLEAWECRGKCECLDAPPFHSAHQSWNSQRLPGQTGSDPQNLCLLTNDDR